MYNYTAKYKRFDQLLSEVLVDFKNYSLENMIEPQELVKVARRVNYDLGLRILQTKEALLEVEKGIVKLPDDFYTINYGMICGSFEVEEVLPQGTHIVDNKLFPVYKEQPAHIDTCAPPIICSKCDCNPCGCEPTPPCENAEFNPLAPSGDTCIKPRVFLNCKNECFELVQIVQTRRQVYRHLLPLQIIDNAEGIECGCPGLYVRSKDQAWIKNGYLYTNLNCAKVYISYEGMMQDEEGNLLVLDHEMINEYYEYALKKRILENLVMNDEQINQAKIQLIEKGYVESRRYALSIVNTPNFHEMKEVFLQNRKAQYAKYYKMFESHRWFDYGLALNDFR